MRSSKSGVLASLLSSLYFAPMAMGADSTAISHCTAQENIFFSCQVERKIVSICALKNSGEIEKLSYRYGVLGRIENEYVASVHNQRRFFGDVKPAAPQAEVKQVWFVSGDIQYLLTVCTGGDCPHTGGLTVFRHERMLSNTRCAESSNNPPWLAKEVVDFGSNFNESKSNTKLLILMEDDIRLEKIYPPRMQDNP